MPTIERAAVQAPPERGPALLDVLEGLLSSAPVESLAGFQRITKYQTYEGVKGSDEDFYPINHRVGVWWDVARGDLRHPSLVPWKTRSD